MSHRLSKGTSEEKVKRLPLHKQIALGEKPRKPVRSSIKK